jgi:hypothetical protein
MSAVVTLSLVAMLGGADVADLAHRDNWLAQLAPARAAAAQEPPTPAAPDAPAPPREPLPPAPPREPAAQLPPRPAAPPARGAAPNPQPPAEAAAPETPVEPEVDDDGDEVVRVGSDYSLAAGERIRELVVVMGSGRVDGHVAGDVVVILGEARIGPTAVIEGDLVVVGGSLTVAGGATASRDVVVVGGAIDAPPAFMPGGEQVIIGFKALGDSVRGFLPWLMRGLLLGRPIVPDLPWVWAVVGVLFLIYVGVLLVFEHPVRATADALSATPLRALVTGLGVLVLALPAIVILVATVVGLLVIPVALCALVVAGLVGRIAAARWLGSRVLPEGEDSSRLAFLRSFAIGCALLILVYMVPVLGGMVWALLGASGLGAATLAFMAAYRKENPPVPLPPSGVPPLAGGVVAAPDPTVPPPLAGAALADDSGATLLAGPPGLAAAASTAVQPLALFPRASFTDRLAAFVLDAILVAIVIGILPTVDDEAFVPLFLGYRFVMWVWKGVTVGGIICQLRITKVDGSAMSGGEALVRSLGSLFSVAVFGIGCLWVLRDQDRQAWHDKMAGTFVVKVPRNWPV